MTVRYHILQITPDLSRAEYRGIAVIVDDGGRVVVRTIADLERLEGRAVELPEFASGVYPERAAALAEWLAWVNAIQRDRIRARDLRRFLSEANSKFGVVRWEEGTVGNVRKDPLDDVADWLVQRLIGDQTGFRRRVWDLLGQSEIRWASTFKQNVAVSVAASGSAIDSVHFDFSWVGKSRVLCRTIPTESMSHHEALSHVGAVELARVGLNKGGERNTLFAILVGAASEDTLEVFRKISARISVINVRSVDAANRIRAL